MKRVTLLTISLLMAAAVVAGERPVSFDKLPLKARNFVEAHFAGLKLTYAKYDSEITDNAYELLFDDGTTIEFSRRGEWRKVSAPRRGEVPAALLPADMVSYISANFPTARVVEVERHRKEYDVELSNDVEIRFDQRGRVKWYD